MYKILGADKKEYGPATADQIRQWIAEGRVTAGTQVQAEGSSQWKSVSEFREFDAALAARVGSPAPMSPPGPPSISPTAAPTSGLAVTSLVLGVLSFVGCSILTGIPAIITGHIAHNRSRKSPQQFGGGGLALAGLIMGYLSLVFIPIMAGMMLPALAKAKDKAQRINCVNNMKQIGLAARMWSNDHNGKFPPDFSSISNELVTPKVLVCPGDRSKTRAMDWSMFGPDNVSYEYVQPGYDEKVGRPQTVVFQCPIHGNVGLADGSVQQGNQRTRNLRR
jgi:hypothetical protein